MNSTIHSVGDDEALSMAVVRVLSIVTDTQPVNLQPLYDSIDPEALDRLFKDRPCGRIAFDHMGHRITVDSNGGRTMIEILKAD